MVTRSLRWRLQGWYAVVLLAVVGGFASLLYAQVRAARLPGDRRGADGRRPVPRHEPAPIPAADARRSAGRRRPPAPVRRTDRPTGPPTAAAARPAGGPATAAGGRPPRPNRGAAARGPERCRRGRAGVPSGATYFAVWRADGNLLKAADLPADVATAGDAGRRPASDRFA